MEVNISYMVLTVEEVSDRSEPRKFSPNDAENLPLEYRRAATRMLQFHANSEIMGALMEKPFIRQAPSIERKLAYSAKVQDEIGHGQLLYGAAEKLGVKTREEMLDELVNGTGKFLNCFHYGMDSWYDVPMIAFFVDGAAMRRQATLKRSSWEPYAHAMDKICFEEGFHIKHGESILSELMNGSKREQQRTQESFEKWWPRILQFFGPVDDKSTHHDFAEKVGLKTATNDDLRQSFLNQYIPKAEKYGLDIPNEPRITKDDETGDYKLEEDDLDWEEFWEISKNDHPKGQEQIAKLRDGKDALGWVESAVKGNS